ncbi:twin-arginine translocase TatA/TatE family subunit [Shumkonia mesophila]|uniref:twin-arginine translocase TatA/TatE family subunit n=1 Tax=Shumkonia mesophila TaxID=2838854 RepID=UPI002934EF0A|nr:twin-arginine translocase TatA/TatE family subunit [Shumkonia mesophila]
MGTFSIWHWLIVLLIVLVLFGGRGKVSALMGDFGKGLKSFKKGMKEEDDDAKADAPKAIKSESAPTVDPVAEKDSVNKN